MKLMFTLILAVFMSGCFAPTEAAFTRGKLAGKLESSLEELAKTSEQKDVYIAKDKTDEQLAALFEEYKQNRAKCETMDEVAWVVENYIAGREKTIQNGIKEYWRLNESTQDITLAKQGVIILNEMSDREMATQRAQVKEFFEKDFVESVAPVLLQLAEKYKATDVQQPDGVEHLEGKPIPVEGDVQ